VQFEETRISRAKQTYMEIVKEIFNCLGVKGKRQLGPSTWRFLLLLNMRKTRRGAERETHTQANLKKCSQLYLHVNISHQPERRL